jgi:hypothetical protein
VYFTNRTKATTPVTLRDELKFVTGGSPYIHPAVVLSICPVRERDGRDGIITARSGVPNDFADVAPCLLASLAGGVRFHRQPDGTKWR